ncbi:hypothetical protein Bca101_067029 [Brassica carinata]
MTQGQWITKSGGKMVEGPKPGLKISVPRFDNSGLIASYAKTLIGRCMNPPKQAMKMLLFMLPRIWQVEGRVVGTDLGRGRFQFAFESEEDIVEVLNMEPFHFDAWMISLSQCPSGQKTVEAGRSSNLNQPDLGANASSYRGAVLKDREQDGEGRDDQQYRNTNGKEGNKGKGLAKEREISSRFEVPKYKNKERFPRGNGEGSSFHGPREQGRRYAPQIRDNQYVRRGNEGPQLNPEKLMVDAFKGIERAPKTDGFSNGKGGRDTANKTRKALLFEEVPEAERESENLIEERTEASEEKVKEPARALEDTASAGEVDATEDLHFEEGELFDSDILVDTDELQDWEQSENVEYQEELEREDSNMEGGIEEMVEEQVDEVLDKDENQEKDTKKKAVQEAIPSLTDGFDSFKAKLSRRSAAKGSKRARTETPDVSSAAPTPLPAPLVPSSEVPSDALPSTEGMGGKGVGVAKKVAPKASKGAEVGLGSRVILCLQEVNVNKNVSIRGVRDCATVCAGWECKKKGTNGFIWMDGSVLTLGSYGFLVESGNNIIIFSFLVDHVLVKASILAKARFPGYQFQGRTRRLWLWRAEGYFTGEQKRYRMAVERDMVGHGWQGGQKAYL